MAQKDVVQNSGVKKFPPEAYQYLDDVTSEAVEEVRATAKTHVESDEWEVIDGFGQVVSA